MALCRFLHSPLNHTPSEAEPVPPNKSASPFMRQIVSQNNKYATFHFFKAATTQMFHKISIYKSLSSSRPSGDEWFIIDKLYFWIWLHWVDRFVLHFDLKHLLYHVKKWEMIQWAPRETNDQSVSSDGWDVHWCQTVVKLWAGTDIQFHVTTTICNNISSDQ